MAEHSRPYPKVPGGSSHVCLIDGQSVPPCFEAKHGQLAGKKCECMSIVGYRGFEHSRRRVTTVGSRAQHRVIALAIRMCKGGTDGSSALDELGV